jgi:uncharacterized secreted protein with C-terminal beta-propeller domain
MKTLSQLKTPSLSLGRLGIIAIALSGLSACYEFDSDSSNSRDKKAGIQLKESASQKEFKQYLTASFTQRAEPVVYNEINMMENIKPIADSSDDDRSTGDFSGTNNQVTGVDEGDIWKYDGENFFVLKPAVWGDQNTSGKCNTAWAPPGHTVATVIVCQPTLTTPSKLRIVKNNKTSLSTIELINFNPSDLYLTDKNAVILGNQYPYQNSWSPEQNWKDEVTHLTAYNIENKAEPELSLSLSIEGQMIKSRRIGDEIFVISRYRPSIPELIYFPKTDTEIAKNKRIINNLSLSELMPKITINDQQHELIADNICLIPDVYNPAMGSPSLTMMTRINTKTAEFNSRCMAGEVAGIYMSENNLYTFNTSYWDFSDNATESLHWNEGNTHLHKFGLESFAYQGSALVEGQLASNNPRLRLGELKDGSIALVTSKRPSNNSWRLTQHKLTVLNNQDGKLKTIADLPNDDQPAAIGKVNEEIYSVRFMQDRAYIVTFEKVDPLYVIDLSDPFQPNIAGELEIPGYSDYLHPIGNDLLLGIGKDAVVGDSGTSWYQGVKVLLFDVKNIQQPTELGSIIIGKRGSSTALEYDLHSFTGIQQNDQYRFAFPISVNDGPAQEDNWGESESQFYQWSQAGLYLFEVKENQLTQMGALITERRSDSNIENNYWPRRYSSRGLIQGDDVYHLNGDDLYKANWHSPEQLSEKF